MTQKAYCLDYYYHSVQQSRRIKRIKCTMLNKWQKTRKTKSGNYWMFHIVWVELIKQSDALNPDMNKVEALSKLASYFATIPVTLQAPREPVEDLNGLRREMMDAVTHSPLMFAQRWAMQSKIGNVFSGVEA